MRLLLLVRTTAVCCASWFAFGLAASGQTNYLGSGEYPVAGALSGDQVRPGLSISASGGYLVWQDNATCPHGLGIGALALDNNLHAVGARFRVNRFGFGDDEHPQVALLNNGGAVFVWQGGSLGFQHIYARFLAPGNTWFADEALVSAATNCFQINPAVVCLANGNVAVVWSSYNQISSSSMQDVFCQLLSPTGQKIGSEFLVNQFASFNQRTPAVAALNGGFVVSWISEQQRATVAGQNAPITAYTLATGMAAQFPSVDVYARSYDATGAPLGDEFLVNTGNNICAHPSITGAPDGSFMVAWDERDSSVQMNGLDVFIRAFPNGGQGGAVRRVNTQLIGDQYVPQLRAVGTNYLMVWTSLGQDGSREGVYGQFLQPDGSALGGEFRVNGRVVGSQKEPALAADGAGRCLTAWTSYTGGASGFDLFAQSYASPGFVPLSPTNHYGAPPPEAFVDIAPAAGNGIAAQGTLPPGLVFGFPAAYASPGLPDPFASSQGAYNGLFYDPNGVSAFSAGYFNAKVTAQRAYSAKLMLGGRTYSVSGRFDANGQDTRSVRRGGPSADLTVVLQLVRLDAAGGSQIRGTITNRQWSAALMADRLVYSKSSKPATTYKGAYTVAVAPAPGGPDGTGFATLKVDSGGTVFWSATLADGSKVTQGSALSEQGYWPLYGSVYRGSGLIAGWAQFSAEGLHSKAIWIKPGGAAAPFFPGAFTNEVDVAGASYTPLRAADVSLLDSLRSSNLGFSGGVLSQPLTKALAFDSHNRLLPASQLSLKVSLTSGLFSGSAMLLPEPGKVFFRGVLLEHGNHGVGFFQDNRNRLSGQIYWDPAQ
jgi:hypothetical protein